MEKERRIMANQNNDNNDNISITYDEINNDNYYIVSIIDDVINDILRLIDEWKKKFKLG